MDDAPDIFAADDDLPLSPDSITEPLPPNPRVQFMVSHWTELELWTYIPTFLGIAFAPLYDHRDPAEVIGIVAAMLGGNWLLVRWAKPLIQERIGVFGPATFVAENTVGLPSRNPIFGDDTTSETRQPKRRRINWRVLTVYVGVLSLLAYVHRGAHFYRGDGWIEGSCGIWAAMTNIVFLNRAFDPTNYRPRQYWYCLAAVVLTCEFYFLGLTPASFAVMLVLLGTTYIAVALLDLWMLFHFASTPLNGYGADMEEPHG